MEKFQELIATSPGKLTEDNLIEMQASELVPDEKEEYIEEAVPAKKKELDKLAEEFCETKIVFHSLTIWTLL